MVLGRGQTTPDCRFGITGTAERGSQSIGSRCNHSTRSSDSEGPHACAVPSEVGVVEEVAPLAARPAAEERGGVDPVLPTTSGNGRVGPVAHRLERRRVDQLGPPVLVHLDAEVCGQLPHLSLQVGPQGVVVQPQDVEAVGGIPEGVQVFDGAPQRRPDLRGRRLVVDPLPEAVPLAVRARPRWRQRVELDAVDRCRPLAGVEERADVHVVYVAGHRQHDVAGVTPDADVRDCRIVGYPVEGGVGLDEPAVHLGCQVGEHLRAGAGHHVDPRRECVQRERQLRFLQHEQRADHLCPRRPALWRRADDDVATTELEAVPAAAVIDGPLVTAHSRHPRSRSGPVRPRSGTAARHPAEGRAGS